MSLDHTDHENDLFYQPEDRYWDGHDKLGFESDHMIDEWPLPANLFVRRMALMNTADKGLHNLAIGDFLQIVGTLLEQDQHSVYRFLVVPMTRDASTLSLTMIGKVSAALPPLRADNIGSLPMAFAWMAKQSSSFEVSCAADGNYWIHRP
ncbi:MULTISPECIES: hypothetical protein [Pseudomonas]|uniref:hypothetical protein n=1 Tax=Pseudomonas TaxID=286 RepID=UPI00070DA9D1|nr:MULTISPECIES: hypothetical protein [Pseudomonas]KQW19825.1 hypothetical protein ASC85_08225 [Pseudomonas sp. Root401]WHS57409.1 hypothetical protein QLH64_30800 [Pseudomonas brassicacearum]WNZ87510.1 hypothetical protein QOM10_29950 [Pseudomonas sp. P108]